MDELLDVTVQLFGIQDSNWLDVHHRGCYDTTGAVFRSEKWESSVAKMGKDSRYLQKKGFGNFKVLKFWFDRFEPEISYLSWNKL